MDFGTIITAEDFSIRDRLQRRQDKLARDANAILSSWNSNALVTLEHCKYFIQFVYSRFNRKPLDNLI